MSCFRQIAFALMSALLSLATVGARAEDRMDLEGTTITGNRELPKVLYIVPWKDPDLGELAGRPVNSVVDEALEPIDREVFRRQLHYYDVLHSSNGTQ
jgi:hypothetical protein